MNTQNNKENLPEFSQEDLYYRCAILNIDNSIQKRRKKLGEQKLSQISIYRCIKGDWRMAKEQVEKLDFVIAQFDGKLQEVFKPEKWYKVRTSDNKGERFTFEGDIITSESIRKVCLSPSIPLNKGQNPVEYINIKRKES